MRSERLTQAILLSCLIFSASNIVFAGPSHPDGPAHVSRLSPVKSWFILLDYDPARYAPAPSDMLRYDLAILDPDSHPPLDPLQGGMLLIAYVSAGEAETYRPYWERIKDRPWVLDENPDWKENYRVDVRSEEWQDVLLDEVIPAVLRQGFDGLMLDTLDVAAMLEERSPDRFRGVKQAMVDLVRMIREKYPDVILISNNGYTILQDIAPFLSGLLAEDIFMMPDFDRGGYRRVPARDRFEKVSLLRSLRHKHGVAVFNIDYVPRGEERLVRECMEASRRLGFVPYVAEKDLSEIHGAENL